MEEIHGYIENIVFCDEEKGFTVARLKEPRKAELTCIVGILPSIQPGETIRCKGNWKLHPQHGMQFEVASFELQAPADLVGIQKYLESGMIKGIGPIYAERIVKKFGTDTLAVIDQSPERLLEVEGIGEKRVDKIGTCWQQQKAVRDVMIFLRGHNISPSYAQKIFKTYGDKSIEKVKTNPYALAREIYGIGFKIADGIAKGMGMSQESSVRVEAGIEHLLWELSNEGHTCFPCIPFQEVARDLLQVPQPLVQECLQTLVQNGYIIRQKEKENPEEEFVWIKPLFLCELGIARELFRLWSHPSPLRSINVDKALQWAESELRIRLAIEQKQAVSMGVSDKISIITGGPGTGKSTITKAILAITSKLTNKILLAAPTGRAAKRMSEITYKKAFTIHALLEMDFTSGGFKRNKENPLECDLVIIDESSMIDTQLMYHLLKAIPSHARAIFIGDIDQLPSVGPGNVLREMIQSECLKLVRLKHIFRQGKASKIVSNAHRINHGIFPDIEADEFSDFDFIEAETPEEVLKHIVDLVQYQLPKKYHFHRFDDIQVLSPMKKGIIGTENLNIVLQQKLNPHPTPLFRMGKAFHLGDKVMQIRNNYQKNVYNGDVGKIIEIDLIDQNLKVVFDEKMVSYEFAEIDELILAYAVSIHKYQGSECPCIIIPIHTTHFKMLHRNLIYTGITRGKKRVVLIGTKKAIVLAIKNEEVRKRYTGLKKRILEFIPKNS